jgi:hypothetical protein
MMHFFDLKPVKILLILIYAATIIVMCRYEKKNSYYDLDIVIYAACVLDNGSLSHEQVHKQAYEMARRDLGEQKFKLYTDSAKYFRNAIYKSAENFYSQLPFYRVKPFYVALLSTAYKLGFSPIIFSTYVNLFCYILIAIILLVYLIKHLNFAKGYFISLCIILMPITIGTAQSNTPDMLTALFFLIAVLMLLSKSNPYMSLVPFCLLVLTRPENIIFIVALCVFCLLLKLPDYSKKFMLILLVCSFLCYEFGKLMYSQYSWGLLYKHSCIGYIPDLHNASNSISIIEYLMGLRFLVNAVFHSDIFLLILLTVYPLLYLKHSKNILFVISYALLASILVRMLLFPDVATRFFVGSFLIAFILFFRLLELPNQKQID